MVLERRRSGVGSVVGSASGAGYAFVSLMGSLLQSYTGVGRVPRPGKAASAQLLRARALRRQLAPQPRQVAHQRFGAPLQELELALERPLVRRTKRP